MGYEELLSPDRMEKAIYKVLMQLHAQAILLVPVDSGQLRNSLSYGTKKRNAGFNKEAGDKANDSARVEYPDSDYVGVMGTNIEYAAAVEFGRPDMPAYPMQPYMRPAAAIVKQKAGIISKEELDREIKSFLNTHPFLNRRSSGEILKGINA